ncbi:uncharacterized protein K02A2.6-like [Octopus sinensis]|uniref:Uncharacterized protein K02A2.6-like n=1 Tax=Octopus sinensis TaxID=2607531 RepID=A0A6P7SZD0_9MOLL|nr:uncharacterized protein K02A2.6-like [Octopus sinensis]
MCKESIDRRKHINSKWWYGCGDRHLRKDCPFKDKTCFKCGKIGHIQMKCRSKKVVKPKKFCSTKINYTIQNRKFVLVEINDFQTKMKLDTGSDVSIINTATWNKIGRPVYKKTTRITHGVSGEQVQFLGKISPEIKLKNMTRKSKLTVSMTTMNLFGTDLMEEFDLWDLPLNTLCNKVNVSQSVSEKASKKLKLKLKKMYPMFSKELGMCKKIKVKFELKENAVPVFKLKRDVPFVALNQVEKELQRLEDIEVIEKVDYFEWTAPTVIIKKKNNEIRICADFSTGLNDCLKNYNYPLPNPEEIFAKCNGGKISSKLDLSEAHLQLLVDEECAKVLTINTHKGLYHFKRLPFGVKVALAIFQQVMDTMLADCEFAVPYLDDILIKRESREQNIEHIEEVFKQINDYGFKVSEDKCEFFLTKIKYLGQFIDENG